jgi:hypothetical protein
MNVGLGDGLTSGEALWLADSDGLGDSPELSLVEALAEEVALAVLLEEAVTEPLAVGENTDEGEEVLDPEQAESATQASTVVRHQPTAVSLTRCAVHAMAVRAFIEPPHALGNHHFPVADRRNRRRR